MVRVTVFDRVKDLNLASLLLYFSTPVSFSEIIQDFC
jgi:hypothetical protein